MIKLLLFARLGGSLDALLDGQRKVARVVLTPIVALGLMDPIRCSSPEMPPSAPTMRGPSLEIRPSA